MESLPLRSRVAAVAGRSGIPRHDSCSGFPRGALRHRRCRRGRHLRARPDWRQLCGAFLFTASARPDCCRCGKALGETGGRLIQNHRAGDSTWAAVGILRNPRSLRKEASRAACNLHFFHCDLLRCRHPARSTTGGVFCQRASPPPVWGLKFQRAPAFDGVPGGGRVLGDHGCCKSNSRAMQPYRGERQVIFSCDAH